MELDVGDTAHLPYLCSSNSLDCALTDSWELRHGWLRSCAARVEAQGTVGASPGDWRMQTVKSLPEPPWVSFWEGERQGLCWHLSPYPSTPGEDNISKGSLKLGDRNDHHSLLSMSVFGKWWNQHPISESCLLNDSSGNIWPRKEGEGIQLSRPDQRAVQGGPPRAGGPPGPPTAALTLLFPLLEKVLIK